MGPALFIVLGSGCLVLQGARLCTPQRGGVRGGAGGAGRCEHRPLQGFVIAQGLRFPGWPRALPLVRRGGIYPSRGCLRRRGVRRDEGIPPYGRFIGSAYAGKAACFRRGVRGFPVGRGPAVGRRGGIYPSRGCSRRRGVRRDEGIPPYGHFIGSAYTGKSACFRRGVCGRGMPLPYMPSGNDRPHGKAGCPPGGKPIVGADSISAQECLRRGGVARDDASIVPYRGLRHRRVRIFPVGRGPAVGRRGGIYPSRGCLRRRGVARAG